MGLHSILAILMWSALYINRDKTGIVGGCGGRLVNESFTSGEQSSNSALITSQLSHLNSHLSVSPRPTQFGIASLCSRKGQQSNR